MVKGRLLYKYLWLCLLFLNTTVTAKTEYWQQRVDTRMQVSLDDVNHILRGTLDLDYYNNSHDTLTFIYFHIWANAYSHDRSAYNKQAVENGKTDFYTADKTDWGFIDSLRFNVNNVKATIESTNHRDIIKVVLPEPLLPGQHINIFTPFYLQIPRTFSRLGHEGQSYQFTQWFPKPAVYDKNGWNAMPYLDQGEFFSEFGSYDVQITLPENYIVIATGNLQTPSEIAFMDSLAALPISTSDSITNPESKTNLKTIRFTEDNVHDFAWFADKRWAVRKGSVKVPETGHEVTLWSAFYPTHLKGWKNSVQYIAEGIVGFSEKVGPYPYQTMKAVEGPLIAGGGMEYPTVTIIIPSKDSNTVREIIIHEVGHNWFYGMLANNERLHPWMDESFTTQIENEIVGFQSKGDGFSKMIDHVGYALYNSGRHSQPLSLPATQYRANNYGVDIYQRGAQSIDWLKAYIGADTFHQILRKYYDMYKFKHVYPEDLEQVFREGTSKSLDWFFGPALNSDKTIDFNVTKVRNTENATFIDIKNNGRDTLPAIVEVKRIVSGDTIVRQYSTPAFKGRYSLQIPKEQDASIIGASIASVVPDSYFYNNYHRNGKTAPLRFRPFISLNPSPTYDINYLPAMAYNIYDGFQLGVAFHNITIPQHRWQFAIAPMYGFGSNKLTGLGWLSYTAYPNSSFIHNIEYGLGLKRFGYKESDLNIDKNIVAQYFRITPEVFVTFKRPNPRATVYRTLQLKAYLIEKENLDFKNDPVDDLIRPSMGIITRDWYMKLKYHYDNYRTYNPYSYTFEAHGNGYFTKLSLEGKLRVDYHYKNKSLYLRGFVGKMFDNGTVSHFNYNHYFTTGYRGVNDYLYDDYYIGRSASTGFFSRQVSMKEGGFKLTTPLYAFPLGFNNDWYAALNLKTDLPIPLPIRLYFDIATFTDAQNLNPSGAKFLWDAGLEIDLKAVQIYIPIMHSQDYKDYLTSVHGKKKFWNSISFSIPINNFRISQPVQSSSIMRKQILN